MFGRSKRPEPDAIEVILGPRASFSGDLRCDASIRIDGTVDGGTIETPANVVLTETARAHCDIMASTVSIRGVYRGVLQADRVELLEGAQVYGALHVNSFYMDDGVLLKAELNIQGTLANGPQFAPQNSARQAAIPVLPRTNSSPSGHGNSRPVKQ